MHGDQRIVMARPHYHYTWPHGRPCENQDCPDWVVEAVHAPDEPCTCGEAFARANPQASDGAT